MKKHPTTWLGYQQDFGPDEALSDLVQSQAVNNLLNLNQQLMNAFSGSIPALFVLDYTTGSYLTMSKWVKDILINGADFFLDGGTGYTTDIYHNDDLKVFNEQVFGDRLGFLKTLPVDSYGDYIFSYNFRLKNKFGEYVNIIQRNSFLLPDIHGNPRLSFGFIMKVQGYISSNPITSIIEKVNGDHDIGNFSQIYKKKYFLDPEDALFSSRELEVLNYMSEGLVNRQIAKRLHLSEHTVINHKRNMLEKSGCPNGVALVSYALRVGLL